MQNQGPSLWVHDWGPAQPAGSAVGSWQSGLLLVGRVAPAPGPLAASPGLQGWGRDARQHALSPETQWLQKVRSLQALALTGSWLPGSGQGCWHPAEPQVELPNSQLQSQVLGGLRQAPAFLSTGQDRRVGLLQLLNVSSKDRKKVFRPIWPKPIFYKFFSNHSGFGPPLVAQQNSHVKMTRSTKMGNLVQTKEAI